MLIFVLERGVTQMALVRDGTPGHAFLNIDTSGRLVDWNDGAVRLFGHPPDVMVGQRLTALQPREGDVDDPPSDAWCQSMLRAETGDVEVWLTRADGRAVWCRTSSIKVSGAIGQSQFIVVVHDLTERRGAEARMRSLMTAIEQTTEGILLADAGGRVQYANPGFAQLAGGRTEALLGRPLCEVGREPGVCRPGDALFDAVTERRPWVGRLAGRRGDRSTVEEAAVMPIWVEAGAGVVTGFLLRRRDVTEEVALRERLRRAQKLEAFGRLAAGVAHDFGNLMTIVAAQNDALTSPDIGAQARAEARASSGRAVERASMLIRQLLAFSRRSAGRPRVLDVNVELHAAAAMLGRIVGEELALVVEAGARRSSVLIDQGQLEQVVVNLVVNARDAQQGRGRVVLATSDAADAPGWLELRVTDDGPGIPSDKLSRIFEPFFTTKATGTGLGLSIVREIVEEAGGSVGVESVVGAGTTFRIRLRVSAEPLSELRAPAPGGVAGKRGTVLVVEDEEDLLTAMRANLVRHGFDVLTAGSTAGGNAVAASHSGRIDLLLTDMTMPGGSGRLLAEQLLADRPGLKVLFMSGYSGDVAVREGRSSLGEFIAKPFVFDDLVRRIETMLASAPGPGAESAASGQPRPTG
jgi:two-component system cell cycle sensor histidine kinase/response regulator CckA